MKKTKKILSGLLCTLISIVTLFFCNAKFKTYMINVWFDMGTYSQYADEDLHKYSQWVYLSEQQFAEIVKDGISKLESPLKDSDNIFELGVGVGATIKVIQEEYPNIRFGGSDFSHNAIQMAKNVFPHASDNFHVHDMTQKHTFIEDNTYDHVFSFGALGMYLTQDQMIDAIKEAVRITKPGGSLLFTHFIEPGAQPRKSIVAPISKSCWLEQLPELGIEDIRVEPMKHQGDRYQIVCKKKRT